MLSVNDKSFQNLKLNKCGRRKRWGIGMNIRNKQSTLTDRKNTRILGMQQFIHIFAILSQSLLVKYESVCDKKVENFTSLPYWSLGQYLKLTKNIIAEIPVELKI